MRHTVIEGGLQSLRTWCLSLLVAVLAFLCCATAHAQGLRQIDHAKTGFDLTGVHMSQRCESCHMNGVFKGTPTLCSSCHTNGMPLANQNVVKTQNHIPTTATCDTCHNTITFSNTQFSHAGVSPTNCTSCHNGVIALGKPAGHIPTTMTCSACHGTTAWLPATGVDHTQFTAATQCATCHNGVAADGKPANHMPTTLNCYSCHSPTASTFVLPTWSHTQMPVTGVCSTCHTGAYLGALGLTPNHIPYQTVTGVAISNCDTCHRSGYTSFNPGQFHVNVSVSNQCATCHLTSAYGLTSKPTDSVHTSVTGNCESCHVSTASWTSTTKPDHSSYTSATVCSGCHNGTNALGKVSTHMPTTLECGNCHNPVAVDFSTTTWNHTQMPVAGVCSTCHTGAYLGALGKTANHIPYLTLTGVAISNCDTCHKAGYSSFNPGVFHANVSISTQCATCHLTSAYGLTSKPSDATHATVTGTCENCHNSTASWTSTTRPDHSTFTVATVCTTCHNGTTAKGMISNHMPTTLQCGNCHTPTAVDFSTTTWNHTQMPVTGVCGTCHSGAYYLALGKTANHIPYASLVGTTVSPNACDTCHKAGYTSFNPGKFHANVTVSGGCTTCHGTAAYGDTVQPTNHIPLAQLLAGTTLQCNSCHTSTSAWTTYTMNHNNTSGNGAGWCIGCHAQGLSYLGNIQYKSVSHKKSGVPDCSYSGCHKPTGNTGSTYKSFN